MKICTWPSYPSPDAHVTPFLHGGDDASKTQTNFIGRKDRLMKLGNRLPELQIELLEELVSFSIFLLDYYYVHLLYDGGLVY